MVEAQKVQEIFNTIAPVYDRLNDYLSLGQHKIWKLMAIKWCNPQPYHKALDLCCGSGDMAKMLTKYIPDAEVVGVDFSTELLNIARQTPPREITWIEADVLNLPFEDNYFDCATMGYGLRNVTDIPQCLQELRRVLKPRAKAAILDLHRPEEPWMRTFQQWYLDRIVVPAAASFGLTQEYAYIYPSLAKFPTGPQQVKLAYEVGFTHAVHYPLVGGMMGILVVTK